MTTLRSFVALAFVATFALASEAAALALDDALRAARARSQALVATEAEVVAASERAVAAGQLPDPMLKFGVNNLPIEGPDRFNPTRDSMTMHSVGVTQELTRADKRQARVRRAEAEIESGRIARLAQLAELQRETTLAWLERSYLESMRELLRRQVAEAELFAQGAEVSYRAGRGTQPEIFAARAAAESLRDRIAETERRVATATTQLKRWVGSIADRPLGERPALDRLPFGPAEIRRHVEHHPALLMAANREALASAEIDIATEARKPDWSVELMYSKRGSAYSDMISLNVSVPLPFDRANRQDREVAARVALREQARAEREERLRAHEAEALAWIQEWQSLRERIANYGRTLLPLARQRAESALTTYRAGTGTLASALEGRRMELDLLIEQLRLQMDAARVWAQLNYLVPSEMTR